MPQNFEDEKTLVSGSAVSNSDSGEGLPRKTIVNWKRGRLLGEGSMGRVFLAVDKDTGELLAVKQLLNTNVQNAQATLKEIELMKPLRHNNIIRYLGAEVTSACTNIFMEYVAAGSIAALLQQLGKFPERVIRVYTKQVVHGLIYLHNHFIIHRDIKGANVLVDTGGTVKLTDFGCSKNITDTEATKWSRDGIPAGSPRWMSPEAIRCTNVTYKTDIWSLGCLVVEMATAQLPWQAKGFSNEMAAMFHIAQAERGPPFPATLSQSLQEMLAGCFCLEPTGRPSAQEMLDLPFLDSEDRWCNSPSSRVSSPHLRQRLDSTQSITTEIEPLVVYNPEDEEWDSTVLLDDIEHDDFKFGMDDDVEDICENTGLESGQSSESDNENLARQGICPPIKTEFTITRRQSRVHGAVAQGLHLISPDASSPTTVAPMAVKSTNRTPRLVPLPEPQQETELSEESITSFLRNSIQIEERATDEPKKTSLLGLPEPLLFHILQFSGDADLCHLSAICQSLHLLLESWKERLWRALFIAKFGDVSLINKSLRRNWLLYYRHSLQLSGSVINERFVVLRRLTFSLRIYEGKDMVTGRPVVFKLQSLRPPVKAGISPKKRQTPTVSNGSFARKPRQPYGAVRMPTILPHASPSRAKCNSATLASPLPSPTKAGNLPGGIASPANSPGSPERRGRGGRYSSALVYRYVPGDEYNGSQELDGRPTRNTTIGAHLVCSPSKDLRTGTRGGTHGPLPARFAKITLRDALREEVSPQVAMEVDAFKERGQRHTPSVRSTPQKSHERPTQETDSSGVPVSSQHTLLAESRMYRLLESAGFDGAPKALWFGPDPVGYDVLVLEFVGPSLNQLLLFCGNSFSLHTTCMLAVHCVDLLERLHAHAIHGNVVPSHVLIRGRKLFLSNMSLAVPVSGSAGPPSRVASRLAATASRPLSGSSAASINTERLIFASINATLGNAPTRRDDLEALGYMLWYFLHGGLPWIGKTLRLRELAEEKRRFCIETTHKSAPVHLHHFLKAARALRSDERPDYATFRSLFVRLMAEKGLDSSAPYDWPAEAEM
eukprot:TRINITY_DN4160_c0_g1_i1.p1 TRINITY_DN4160_c0_g1~~TRINITY_DN4160_c0_g1_i1.p1  ORF type:complete len:1060 (+),score=126.12 TRINITY_DN4160_c0_g1_i1:592-3771(+)